LFAYLYGVQFDISPIVPFLKERGIDILEDVAESFTGPKNNGSEGATLTMFSFGAIKIQTCIYGGVGVIRDDEKLYNEMKAIQDTYPLFTPQMYRKRTWQMMAFYYLINTQRGNKMFDIAAKMSGQEREEFYVSLSR
jgi:dTDP-4-amino-4,6-dideoxygalactose transaminase